MVPDADRVEGQARDPAQGPVQVQRQARLLRHQVQLHGLPRLTLGTVGLHLQQQRLGGAVPQLPLELRPSLRLGEGADVHPGHADPRCRSVLEVERRADVDHREHQQRRRQAAYDGPPAAALALLPQTGSVGGVSHQLSVSS
ncbi:hypothetical protein BJF86_07355 [Serinicoccus sp. CNJ-927]|uniref:hypothetical protein n=1 Tax=Serinicoccus sp. CNJ-927 TaxID=1904970 RepID=UPI0009640A4A|nr:hypothetical protein [Serinicoccus sp. CNJ-927]OLT39660.1 hypothetical protein BJF86_07355 [Serinicoccus sp. CNJ-927]